MINRLALPLRTHLIAIGVGIILFAAACSPRKEALVIFDVETASAVPAFDQFVFSVSDLPAVSSRHIDATGNRPSFQLGYYMAASGAVTILGQAVRTADGCVVGEGTATATGVQPGKTTMAGALSIVALTAPRCPADAGTDGVGGAGGRIDAATDSADVGAGGGGGNGGAGGTGGGPAGCTGGTHDDGTGRCVASGCATGYHDGGDGTCVASGTCSAGYRTDAGGACITGPATLSGGTSHDFGNLEVGVASAGVTWTVSNTGTAATGTLSLTNGNPAEVMTTNNCGATIAAGAMCTIAVSFKPSALGARSGALMLSASPGGSVTFTAAANGKYRLTITTSGTGTVTSVQSGINCGTTCTALFDAGPVSLQARTSNGSSSFFSGWNGGGGCTGPLRDCTVTLGGSVSIGAVFSPMTNNLIFVTSSLFPTNLGSAAAYDTKCNAVATAAGLNDTAGSSYIACTSDSASQPGLFTGGSLPARLGATVRGWVRMDGAPFLDAQDNRLKTLSSIRFDETGRIVGGSVPLMTGYPGDSSCGDFTSSASASGGVDYGTAEIGLGLWLNDLDNTVPCNAMYRIICMGKTKTAPLAPRPVSGRLIWLSNTYSLTQSPDMECQADKPAGVITAAALLGYVDRPASSVLDLSASYVRPDGILVGTGKQLADMGSLESGIWQFGDGTYVFDLVYRLAYTGGTSPSAATTCNNWTLPLNGSAAAGSFWYADSRWWSYSSFGCGSGQYLYCVQTQ